MSSQTSAPKSREEVGIARRAEIVALFAQMVAERGYDNVSIRDVAEALGLSKGTIVHHFMSKDRLLERVHADYMARRLAELHCILDAADDPAMQLGCVIQQLVACMGSDRNATIAFAREVMRFAADDIMIDVRAMRRDYYSLVRDVLQRGMQDGSFRRDDDAIVALQIFGMANWSWTWFRPEGEWSPDRIAETFIRTTLAGIRSDSSSPLDRQWFEKVRRIVTTAMSAEPG